MRPPYAQLLGPMAVLAIAAFAGVTAWRLGLWDDGNPGSGLLPAVASALLAVLALADASSRLKPAPDADHGHATPVLWSRVAAYAASLAGLVAAMQAIGFVPAALASLVVAVRFGEGRRWRTSIAVAAAGVFFAWLLFGRLLSVPLPTGTWFAAR